MSAKAFEGTKRQTSESEILRDPGAREAKASVHIDDEVVDAVISASERPIWQEQGSERAMLILHFGSHPKVKELAAAELRQRSAQVAAVAVAYANDPQMRELVRGGLGQLPTNLRLQIVERLEILGQSDDAALHLLSAYDTESDEGVKSAAACAYFKGIRLRGAATASMEFALKETLTAIGADCWERRQAALLGLAALDRLDLAVSAVERLQPEPARIRFEGGTRINLVVVRRLAFFWPAFMKAFGNSIWDRVPLERGFLGEMLDFADDPEAFAALRKQWESSNKPQRGAASPLRALARKEPKSQRLLHLCTSILGADDPRDWWGEVAESIAAAEILGEQFGGDSGLQTFLETQALKRDSLRYIVIALSSGWPTSRVLDDVAARERPSHWLFPSEVHLACRRLPADELLAAIAKVLPGRRGDIWDFLPNAARPLLARFSRDSNAPAEAAHRLLHGPTPDEKASLLKIMSRSSGLRPELVIWAREELKRQVNASGLAELGCDLLGARVGPVAHSVLDALEGRV